MNCTHQPLVYRLTLCLLLLLPSQAFATLLSLDPGYTATTVATIPFETRAFTVDADQNLYLVDAADDFSGQITIDRYDAGTGYTTSSRFLRYSTTTCCASGLAFDAGGNLLVSEVFSGGDSGLIRVFDTSLAQTNLLNMPSYRPTGVDADASGKIYFPGRLSSDPTFGNIYVSPGTGTPTQLIGGFVGTGIAVDIAGNILASTPGIDVSPYQSRSIYRFDAGTLSPTQIASFSNGIRELTMGGDENLYVLEGLTSSSATLYQVSAVPPPPSFFPMLTGIAMLAVALRRQHLRFPGAKTTATQCG